MDHFTHIDFPLKWGSRANFQVDSVQQKVLYVARQASVGLDTFSFMSVDISTPYKTCKKSYAYYSESTSVITLPSTSTVYGFTYNRTDPLAQPTFANLLVYNSFYDELRLYSVTFQDSLLTLPYYLPVTKPKGRRLVSDPQKGLGVYMQYKEINNDKVNVKGYYEVYVAGMVEEEGGGGNRDVWVAKVNTKHNLTEWYRTSGESGKNETVRGLHYNKPYELLFVAVEIQGNTYLNSSLSTSTPSTSKDLFLNQSNILLLAYQRYFGVLSYTLILGDPQLNDTFCGLGTFGNSLYVLIKREGDDQGDLWTRKIGMVLYEVRIDTGEVKQEAKMGSIGGSGTRRDEPIDMQVNEQGVYIMAKVSGNMFCLSYNADNSCPTSHQWNTGGYNNVYSLALIYIAHDVSGVLRIIDLDSRPVSSILQRIPYLPQALILHTLPGYITQTDQNAVQRQFLFVGQRDTAGGPSSGLYYSVLEDELTLMQPCSVNTCIYCSKSLTNHCIQCNSKVADKIYENGSCVSTVSNGYSLGENSESEMQYSVPCQEDCLLCDANDERKCTACDAWMTLANVKGRDSCQCSALGMVKSEGQCYAQCPKQNYGILNRQCIAECPLNSLEKIQFNQVGIATVRSQTWTTTVINEALTFKSESYSMNFNSSNKIDKLPQDFTMCLWFMMIDDLTTVRLGNDFEILNAFGRIQIQAIRTGGYGTPHQLIIKFLENEQGQNIIFTNSIQLLTLGYWRKACLSLTSSKVKGLHDLLAFISDPSNLSRLPGYSSTSTDRVGYSQSLSSHSITLGGNQRTFPGAFRDLIILSQAHSLEQLQQDLLRSYLGQGRDKYNSIILYYRFDKDLIYKPDSSNSQASIQEMRITDQSGLRGESVVYNSQQIADYKTPRYKTTSEVLTLQSWNDVAECLQVEYSVKEVMPVVMRGDMLAKGLVNLKTISGGISFQATDFFDLCLYNCSCPQGATGRLQISGIIPNTRISINTMTSILSMNTPQGMHYELCYKRATVLETFDISMGQIYIQQPVKYVYPFNTGSIVEKALTFTSGNQNQAFGDKLVFTISKNCSQVEYPTSDDLPKPVEFIREQTTKFTQNLFKYKGRYLMCWQSSAARDYNQPFDSLTPSLVLDSFIQVNNFNFFLAVHLLELQFSDTPSKVKLNEQYITYNLDGQPFLAGDMFRFYSSKPQNTPCFIADRKGTKDIKMYNLRQDGTPYFAPVWFGVNTGVTGITKDTGMENYLHMCHTSNGEVNDGQANRVENYFTNMQSYTIIVTNVLKTEVNRRYPEIMWWWVDYGGTMDQYDTGDTGVVTDISFRFYPGFNVEVYPCSHPIFTHQKGKIEIQRLAVNSAGTIVETPEFLYQHHNLSDIVQQSVQNEVYCTQHNGICGIKLSQQRPQPGEIYQLNLYTYSFMIKDKAPVTGLDTKYYLFGESQTQVGIAYKHLFFVRGWKLYPPSGGTFPNSEANYLELYGENLKTQRNVRAKLSLGNNVEDADFETQAVNITFQVTGNPLCTILKVPQATVLQEDIHEDKIIIRDLKLNGCLWGELYASIYLWRGVRNPQTGTFTNLYVTNHRDMLLGTLGCSKGCLKCNGTRSDQCQLCKNPLTKYLSNGTCYDTCPPNAPYYMSYTSDFNNIIYTAYQCLEQCPEKGYYAADENQTDYRRSIPCRQCFNGCQKCTKDEPGHCLQCSPLRFLFKGTCLSTCPDTDLTADSLMLTTDKFYFNNYSSYTCQLTPRVLNQNISNYIKVSAVPFGYRHAIPIDELTYLKITVKVNRGQFKGLFLKQMDPQVAMDANTNFTDPAIKRQFAFEGLTGMDGVSGYLPLKSSVISSDDSQQQVTQWVSWKQLRSATFKYQSEKVVYRILVKVINDKGDIEYDIIEFYTNRNPFARELIATSSQRLLNSTFTTTLNITTVNLNLKTSAKGWYDSEDDKTNKLFYQLYAQSKNGRRLIMPSMWQQETFVFKIPHLQRTQQFLEVDFYVVATDIYGASTAKYVTMNVTNTYQESQRLPQILELCSNLTIELNVTPQNQLRLYEIYRLQMMLSNLFEIAYYTPIVPPYQGSVCMFDEECNNGQCMDSRCLCDPGYTGILCQLTPNEYYLSKQASTLIFTVVDLYFSNHTYSEAYTSNDLIYLVMTLKGVLQNFEAVELADLSKSVNYLHSCIFANNQTVYAYDSQFYDEFYDLMGKILAKAQFDMNAQLKGIDEENYQKALKNVMTKVRACIDKFTQIQLLKMNSQTFIQYRYPYDKEGFALEQIQDQYLEVKLFQLNHQDMLNHYNTTTQSLNIQIDEMSVQSFQVNLPWQTLLDENNVGLHNITELRFRLIVYKGANPFLDQQDIYPFIESPYVIFEAFDQAMQSIEVSLKNPRNYSYYQGDSKLSQLQLGQDLIQIQMTYVKTKQLDDDSLLKCAIYNSSIGTFQINNNICGLQLYTPQSCVNCTGDLNDTAVAICYCNQLRQGGVVLMYDPSIAPVEPYYRQALKIGFYQDEFANNNWQDSFGFRAVIGATLVYVLGMLICIVMDIKPRKAILLRLMQDIRNIDRYGQVQTTEGDNNSNTDTISSDNNSTSKRVQNLKKMKRVSRQKKEVKKNQHHLQYEGGDNDNQTPQNNKQENNANQSMDPVIDGQQQQNELLIEEDTGGNSALLLFQKTEKTAVNQHQVFSKSFYQPQNQTKGTFSLEPQGKEQLFVQRNEQPKKKRGTVTQANFYQDKLLIEESSNQMLEGQVIDIDSDHLLQQSQINEHQQQQQEQLFLDLGVNNKLKKKKGLKKRIKKQQYQPLVLLTDATQEEGTYDENVEGQGVEDESIKEIQEEDIKETMMETTAVVQETENNSITPLENNLTPDGLIISQCDQAFEEQKQPQLDEHWQDLTSRRTTRLEDLTSSFAPAFYDPEICLQEDLGKDLSDRLKKHLHDPEGLIVLPPERSKGGGTSKQYDDDLSTNTRESDRTKKKKYEERKRKREEEMKKHLNRYDELQIVEDPTSRHLRPSHLFNDVDLELRILTQSKEVENASFFNGQFKNTKKPLTILDAESMSKDASSLAVNELWIALIIPLVNTIVIRGMSSLFTVTEARFNFSADVRTLHIMITELKKEMKLRFFMAYFLCLAMLGVMLWYVVNFTTLYGWKTSWIWWYCGCFSAIMHFGIYDLMMCLILWSMSKQNKIKRLKRLGLTMSMKRVKRFGFQEA